MIIKKNVLPSNSKFRLTLFVTSPKETEGLGVLQFETAKEPHGGYCKSSVSEGISLETEFTFECFGWQDESMPIYYEFQLGLDLISYGISPKSVSTVLSSGPQEDDYQLQINVIVKNAAGVAVVVELFVKVSGFFNLPQIYFVAVAVALFVKVTSFFNLPQIYFVAVVAALFVKVTSFFQLAS